MTWHDDKAKALTGCKVDEILSEGLIPTYNQNVRDDPKRYARLFKRYVLTLDTKKFDVYGNKLQVMKGDIILSVGGSHDESSMRTALRAKGEDIHIRVLRIAPQKTLRVPVRRLPEHLIRGHVKMMVFDFDNTLSVFHVFKGLIGWGDEPDRPSGPSHPSKRRWGPKTPALNPTRVMQVLQVAEETSPGSSTELGQMRLISRFDAGAGRQKGDFAKIAFGGVVRVIELTKFLKGLKERGVKLYIITKGYIGVVKTCLHHLELLDFFDDMYGKVATSSHYDPSEYDVTLGIRRGMSYRAHRALASREEAELLGEQYQADWNPDHLPGHEQVGGKVDLINYLRKLHRFEREQVVFVDDDPQEIMYAGGTPTPEPERFTPSEFQCLTLQVLNREGMQKFHMEELDRWSTFPSGFPQQAKTTDFEESLETKLFAYGFTDRALKQAYREGFRTEEDVVNVFGPTKDRWNSGLAFDEEASLHEIVKMLAADDKELHPRATELEVRQAFKGDGKDSFFTVVEHIKAQRAMDTEEEVKEKKKKDDEEYATWAAKAVPKKCEQQGQSGFSLVIERTLEHMGYELARMKEAFKALGKEKKKTTVANAIHWFERTKDSVSGWSYADEALILTVVKYGGFKEHDVKQALIRLQELNKEKTYESVVDILENEYRKIRKGTVYIDKKRQPKTPEEKAIARLQAALKKKTKGLTTEKLIADRRELMEAKIECEQCSLTGCEEFVERFAEKLSEYMMAEHPEDVKGIKKQKELAKKQREKDANQPPVGAKKTM
jgi:FMN phosphatase YigB (HAD superfamily)